MKNATLTLIIFIAMTIASIAQIPNSDFENWTTVGNYENPTAWNHCNSSSTGPFFPVTKSSDHYPISVGSYSIRVENQVPLSNCSSFGFAETCDINNPCTPSFPIIGHPTSFCGYYKCFPQNNDTMQIGLMLFSNGVWVAGAELLCTQTVSNWTSFNIPISVYSMADSATIVIAAFYNDTTCQEPYGPFGNSVFYVDNLSFDNLITGISDIEADSKITIYPNPSSDKLTVTLPENVGNQIELKIFNTFGQQVFAQKISNNPAATTLDVSQFSEGIYFLHITSPDKTFGSKKIIIAR